MQCILLLQKEPWIDSEGKSDVFLKNFYIVYFTYENTVFTVEEIIDSNV